MVRMRDLAATKREAFGAADTFLTGGIKKKKKKRTLPKKTPITASKFEDASGSDNNNELVVGCEGANNLNFFRSVSTCCTHSATTESEEEALEKKNNNNIYNKRRHGRYNDKNNITQVCTTARALDMSRPPDESMTTATVHVCDVMMAFDGNNVGAMCNGVDSSHFSSGLGLSGSDNCSVCSERVDCNCDDCSAMWNFYLSAEEEDVVKKRRKIVHTSGKNIPGSATSNDSSVAWQIRARAGT
jgi:hypothetical protein